jgi:hypothetical protein
VYDPTANTWTRKADMPTETWGGMTAVLNDRLYVLTCASEEDCSQFERQILYRYDPASDVWTQLSVTPVELGFPMGGSLAGSCTPPADPTEHCSPTTRPPTNGQPRRAWLAGAGQERASLSARSSTCSVDSRVTR